MLRLSKRNGDANLRRLQMQAPLLVPMTPKGRSSVPKFQVDSRQTSPAAEFARLPESQEDGC